MKLCKIMIFSCLLTANANADEARDIMQKVLDRDDGVEKPRIKVVESILMDAEDNPKDSLSVMIIKKPSGEKGIGFLQFDYDEVGKDTDQWMYLSALGKIKRIVSGNDNEPKKGTLFGSEFGYEDTEKVKLDNYTYRLVKQVTYKGQEAWIIESTPTPQHARKSNYSRSTLWVDKNRDLLRGRLIKQMIFSNYEEIKGIWVAKKMNMNNVQSKRISTMKINNIAMNIKIDPALLSKRTLTDGAFREQHLAIIRAE